MSVFVRHNYSETSFRVEASWVILSPIELSIKRKIEEKGIPLKKWDINIYRGVLTGCNEAFIVNSETRELILNNCKDEAERIRTAELIRPILRGRDIKRYSYEWASLYLISTFPSCRYDIELYPALKNHLLSFGKNKLEQTGKEYIINGEKIKARKKTSNKWFETQDSISYWEDFSKPVIAWQRITAKNQFCLTEAGTIILDSMAFLSHLGAYGNYLLAILNSDLIHFWIKKSVHEYGSTGFRLSNQYVELIPVPVPNESELSIANTLIELYLQGKKTSDEINKFVYTLYGITSEDIITINKIIDASESQ